MGVKVSDLSDAGVLDGSQTFEVVSHGDTRSTTITRVLNAALAQTMAGTAPGVILTASEHIGTGGDSGTGGPITMYAGNGDAVGGEVSIKAGDGMAGPGGTIEFRAGQGAVGDGGNINLYCGNGADDGGTIRLYAGSGSVAGGGIVLSAGSGGYIYLNPFGGITYLDNPIVVEQDTPAAVNATATLTIAQIKKLIVTTTSAVAVSLTLPTGADIEASFPALDGYYAFDWSIINLGSADGAITLVANTDHTIVGSVAIPIGMSARFRTRKFDDVDDGIYITYRIG